MKNRGKCFRVRCSRFDAHDQFRVIFCDLFSNKLASKRSHRAVNPFQRQPSILDICRLEYTYCRSLACAQFLRLRKLFSDVFDDTAERKIIQRVHIGPVLRRLSERQFAERLPVECFVLQHVLRDIKTAFPQCANPQQDSHRDSGLVLSPLQHALAGRAAQLHGSWIYSGTGSLRAAILGSRAKSCANSTFAAPTTSMAALISFSEY